MSADATVKDLVAADPRLRVLETPPLSIVRLAMNGEPVPPDSPPPPLAHQPLALV